MLLLTFPNCLARIYIFFLKFGNTWAEVCQQSSCRKMQLELYLPTVVALWTYHMIRAARKRSHSKEASLVLVHHTDLKHEASFFNENRHCWRVGLRLVQHAFSLILGSILQVCLSQRMILKQRLSLTCVPCMELSLKRIMIGIYIVSHDGLWILSFLILRMFKSELGYWHVALAHTKDNLNPLVPLNLGVVAHFPLLGW